MLNKNQRNIFIHQGNSSIDDLENNTPHIVDKINTLENDLTKALVNTLIYSQLARNIFSDIMKNTFNVSISPDEMNVNNFSLEYSFSKKDVIQSGILLFINSKYNRYIDSYVKQSEKFRIDALLETERFVLGIESKLSAAKNKSQLTNEMKFLNTDKYLHLTWEDIHKIFKKESFAEHDLILKSFIEYLEVIGMNDFEGIPFVIVNGKQKTPYDYNEAKRIINKISFFIEKKCSKDFVVRKETQRPSYVRIDDADDKSTPKEDSQHFDIYLFANYFAIDYWFGQKNRSKLFAKKDRIIQPFISILEEINKLNNDETWFFETDCGRQFKGNQQGPGYLANSHAISLKELFKEFGKKTIEDKINYFIESQEPSKKMKCLKIERKFYYSNPYYTPSYIKKSEAAQRNIILTAMDSPGFIDVIIKTLYELRTAKKSINSLIEKC